MVGGNGDDVASALRPLWTEGAHIIADEQCAPGQLHIDDWWRRAGIHFNAFWAVWKMSLTSSMASLFPVRWGATHTATALYNWDTICITALFNACIDSLLGWHDIVVTERLTALQQFESTRSSPFEEDSTTTRASATPCSTAAL